MPWTLWQLGSVVAKFADKTDEDMWEVMERRLATLRDQGNAATFPVTDSLEDGIFELRASVGNRHSRLLFYFGERDRIVFVHAIESKKRRRTPRTDIEIAKRNRALIRQRERIIHEFNVEPGTVH